MRSLAFTFLFVCTFPAVANVIGRIAFLQGDVKIKSLATGQTGKALLGEDVSEKDTLITGADGRAKVMLEDDNELNVFSNASLEVSQYDSSADKRNALFKLISGKVRAIVKQKYDDKTNRFLIRTLGTEAGVRGTDFLVDFDSSISRTKIVTFEGSVRFAGLGKGARTVNIEKGQSSYSARTRSPSPPTEVASDELAGLAKATDLDIAAAPKKDSQTQPPSMHKRKP